MGKARWMVVAGALGLVMWPGLALANIDVELSPSGQVVNVGQPVSVGIRVRSDSDSNQLMAAAQIVLTWDPAVLHLNGLSQTGAVPLLFSSFGSHPSGLNEANPPADGNAIYQCGAPLGTRVTVTPDGVLLTTLQFTALTTAMLSPVNVPLSLAGPLATGTTIVYDGVVPNLNVTGSLTGATISIGVPACLNPACPSDLNGSGSVNGLDLGILLAGWSIPPGAPGCGGTLPCCADLNGDGVVNGLDLGILLGDWTGVVGGNPNCP